MKILPFVLCSTLLSSSAFAASSNIIINTPNAGVQDPVVNNQIESDNVMVGKDSTFSGGGNLILGSDSHGQFESVAIGNHTSAKGESIALGAGSVAINNSIAIGNQSNSDDGQVSVGNKYHQRRIENMAAGQKDTDGVNVSQLTPLKEGITANKNQIKTVETNVATNSKDITINKGAITTNSTDIATNNTNILTNKGAINSNSADINSNRNTISTNTDAIDRNITNINNNTTHIRSNTVNVQKNTSAITKTKQLATTNKTNISKNTDGIKTNQTNIQHNSDRIDNIDTNNKNYVDNKFNQLKTDIYQVRKRADAGTASAMAMTQIAAPLNGYKYNIGIGIGSYGEQAATAIGAKFRVNQTTTVGLTSSYDSQHNFGTSIGANWSFN
ncbi:YadA C-terminal domain-containing protein [Photobacterium iliopiscarium]|uniref:YadA C-terminal domain-containing protein n=1 Tax=Photobacterium iliopiscarium TaxID=56192 RepID=UPI002431ADCF|nr:YadA-like family protein [Photobacterium iliopiscarium]